MNRSEQAGLTVRARLLAKVCVTIVETAANDRFIGLASDFSG